MSSVKKVHALTSNTMRTEIEIKFLIHETVWHMIQKFSKILTIAKIKEHITISMAIMLVKIPILDDPKIAH